MALQRIGLFRRTALAGVVLLGFGLAGCDDGEDFEGFAKLAEGIYVTKVAQITERRMSAELALRMVTVSVIDQTLPGNEADFLTIQIECASGKYWLVEGFAYADRKMSGAHDPMVAERLSMLHEAKPGSAAALAIQYALASDEMCLKP